MTQIDGKVYGNNAKSSLFIMVLLFAAVLIDWGVIPLSGMSGNIIVRAAIVVLIVVEAFFAFATMKHHGRG